MTFPAFDPKYAGYWTPEAEDVVRELMMGAHKVKSRRMPPGEFEMQFKKGKDIKPVDVRKVRTLAEIGMTANMIGRRVGCNQHRIEKLAAQHGIALAKPKKRKPRPWG